MAANPNDRLIWVQNSSGIDSIKCRDVQIEDGHLILRGDVGIGDEGVIAAYAPGKWVSFASSPDGPDRIKGQHRINKLDAEDWVVVDGPAW
jgi:hypothetical protein